MNEEKNTKKIEEVQLSDREVKDLLIELKYSKFWQPLMIYNNSIINQSDDVLRSVDPFKNPTEVARNQGFRSGFTYLPKFIDEEEIKRAKAENNAKE